MATRTRNEWNRKFEQAAYGERHEGSGQSPASMFLEACIGFEDDPRPYGESRVVVVNRSATGKLSVRELIRTREELLRWTLVCVDGHLTAFDRDDYSARLLVLDRNHGNTIAWIEVLNPGRSADDHPELP